MGDPRRQRGVAVRLQRLRHPGVQRRAAGVRQPVQHRPAGSASARTRSGRAVPATGSTHAHRDRGVDRVHARAPVGRAGPDQGRQVERRRRSPRPGRRSPAGPPPRPASRAATVSPSVAGTRCGPRRAATPPCRSRSSQVSRRKNGLPPVRSRRIAAEARAAAGDTPACSPTNSAMASVSSPARSRRRTPSSRCRSASRALSSSDRSGAVVRKVAEHQRRGCPGRSGPRARAARRSAAVPSAGRRGRRPAAGRGRSTGTARATASNRSRRPSPTGSAGVREVAGGVPGQPGGARRRRSSVPGSLARNRWSSISANGW